MARMTVAELLEYLAIYQRLSPEKRKLAMAELRRLTPQVKFPA